MEMTKVTRPKFSHTWQVLLCIALIYIFTPCLLAEAGNSANGGLENLWFRTDRIPMLIALLAVGGAILYYIYRATKGEKLFLRKIPGVAAVEEAVGRATEMGRSIIYTVGIQDMDNVQTLAGLNILGHVAHTSAVYETEIKVPTNRSLVMSTAQEVVKEAYLRAGRPDGYNSENVFYITDDQFGFAAGVNGMMVREKPATIFMLGAFYAESLVLAETGNRIGAIQIAGTAMPSQIPFFIAACDYTLIGEELFAASAYLSHEPKLLGSLRGQDVGKLCFIVVTILGVMMEILVRYQILPESISLFKWLTVK